MKRIAVFLILMNFMFAWVGALPFMHEGPPNEMSGKFNESTIDMNGTAASGGGAFEEVSSYTTYVTSSISMLFSVIINSTASLPYVFQNPPFNFPELFVKSLVAIQYLIYAIGLIEFLRGASL